MGIYLWRNNTRFGPYPDAAIAAWLLAGTVSYDDLGWREGGGAGSQPALWQPLRVLFPPPPMPSSPTTVPAVPPPLPAVTPPPTPTPELPPTEASIYLSRGGGRYGPYAEAQLRTWLAAGAVLPDDLGWRLGMNAWEPLRVLYPQQPSAPPSSLPPANVPQEPPQIDAPPAPPPVTRAARMGRFLAAAGSTLSAMAASGQLADIALQAARIVAAWNSGYRPMQPDPNAPVFRPTDPTVNPNALPSRVDLRGYFTAVEDQGQLMSCTANAVAGAYEYWVKRHTQQDYDVSRLFIYYNARWRNHEQDSDAGSVIQFAMEGLESFGACAERTWPYEPRLVTTRPNGASFEEATHFKIKEKQLVQQKLDDWRHCLAEGHPIVFGCKLFNSFDTCTQRGGVVPMPDPQELTRRDHGAHSMCCVGYSDSEQVFIVRNSWGTDWGDKGYCYMPYNYLMNEQLGFRDSWIFVPCEQIPAPQDAWGHDNQPVTNDGRGVSFDTNPRPPSDYADIPPDPADHALPEYHEDKPDELRQYEDHVEQGNFDKLKHFDVADLLAPPDEAAPTPTDETPVSEEDSTEEPPPPSQDLDAGDANLAPADNNKEENPDGADDPSSSVTEQESDATTNAQAEMVTDTQDATSEENSGAESNEDAALAEAESEAEPPADDAATQESEASNSTGDEESAPVADEESSCDVADENIAETESREEGSSSEVTEAEADSSAVEENESTSGENDDPTRAA
ncbi:MAG: DUF4339 domain-containing protein [Verrucomicrobia bacterium]|nr:DUF4339 domain-containing protein [Verrucomicrobiota bacterium]